MDLHLIMPAYITEPPAPRHLYKRRRKQGRAVVAMVVARAVVAVVVMLAAMAERGGGEGRAACHQRCDYRSSWFHFANHRRPVFSLVFVELRCV